MFDDQVFAESGGVSLGKAEDEILRVSALQLNFSRSLKKHVDLLTPFFVVIRGTDLEFLA